LRKACCTGEIKMNQISLAELIERASSSTEAIIVEPLKVGEGGVDPLGLRQINFDLMDLVFPQLNNVARHVRPFTLMAWAWRQAWRIFESSKEQAVDSELLRDFVDRVEMIFAWSQFLIDSNADLPGRLALGPVLNLDGYHFGGPAWQARRKVRRYSTGLIAAVNYGPALKSMKWLMAVPNIPNVFRAHPQLDHALDAFEAKIADFVEHPSLSSFGEVSVDAKFVADIGAAWSLIEPVQQERSAAFAKLALAEAPTMRQNGVRLVQAVFARHSGTDLSVSTVREEMGAPSCWQAEAELYDASLKWERLQFRQLFRLSLECLLSWIVEYLEFGDATTDEIASEFVAQVGDGREGKAADFADQIGVGHNPAKELSALVDSLREIAGEDKIPLEVLIARGLFVALQEGPRESVIHEQLDRLPLERAIKEFEDWQDLELRSFFSNVIEHWILAPHAYWSVSRGLADARADGKQILRLRVVMGDAGWTLARPDSGAIWPNPTPDRLETVISMLRECEQL
jgi:hypothetical protein